MVAVASSVTALFAGMLFGFGLMISGMANPAKVQSFLHLAGRWDPSLAFVMIGAIAVGWVAFSVAKRRQCSFLGLPVQLPVSSAVTLRLIAGSAVFGIGWGLAGFCPGPALVALAAGYPKAGGFVAAMLGGMAAFEIVERAKSAMQRA